jgi:site-specific recombinase XerD
MTFTESPAVAAPSPAARKSPLRAATLSGIAPAGAGLTTAEILTAGTGHQREAVPAPDLRRMQISEFTIWMRSRTSKHHRLFQADTIAAYTDAARALDQWMTAQGIDGDFTACDTGMLNRFFTDYLASCGQGGTNTRHRDLRHLFTWLEESHGHPHPWTAALHRYAPAQNRPSTLAQEFIHDLLERTGGGRARRFEDVRDHAMIRVLTEGVRRTELIQLQTTDLSTDLIAQPFVRVVPLKGGRAYTDGRIVPLTAATARAVMAYLRARRTHRLAGTGPFVAGNPESQPDDRVWPLPDAAAPR